MYDQKATANGAGERSHLREGSWHHSPWEIKNMPCYSPPKPFAVLHCRSFSSQQCPTTTSSTNHHQVHVTDSLIDARHAKLILHYYPQLNRMETWIMDTIQILACMISRCKNACIHPCFFLDC